MVYRVPTECGQFVFDFLKRIINDKMLSKSTHFTRSRESRLVIPNVSNSQFCQDSINLHTFRLF